jgi:hypothetical protein
MSASTAAAPGGTGRGQAAPARRRLARRYLPPQHGAWAMLLLPWLAGVLSAEFHWLHLPLLFAWLTGYLFSYYLFLAVKTRRPGRFRPQLLVYAVPTALVGGLVLALRPSLLWYAPAYALLLAVNVGYAARRDERSLLNDLAAVLQSCLMVFVCATVAAVAPADVVVAFVTVTAYFTGTVFHVKTMIRERGNVRYRWASIGYHVAALVGVLWIGPVTAGVFALLLLRATVLPGRRITPVRVGLVEIAASLLVLLAVVVPVSWF